MKQVTCVINQSEMSAEQLECDLGKNFCKDSDVKMTDHSTA